MWLGRKAAPLTRRRRRRDDSVFDDGRSLASRGPLDVVIGDAVARGAGRAYARLSVGGHGDHEVIAWRQARRAIWEGGGR